MLETVLANQQGGKIFVALDNQIGKSLNNTLVETMLDCKVNFDEY